MRLLVVDDSVRIREALFDGLSSLGYAVDVADNGRDAIASARAVGYDAIVLDVMLPESDGLTVLRTLREHRVDAPILLLTARDRVEHRVEGLQLGADDYLIKPFAFEELVARIEALCRRAHGRAETTVEIGGVLLDLSGRRFVAAGSPIDLTPREYSVLELLFLNAGTVMSREKLEEHIYAADRQVWSNAIDSAIAALRRKLLVHGVDELIQTRRGIGYFVDCGGLEKTERA
jgi:DNA-binding response OmpR family regulator